MNLIMWMAQKAGAEAVVVLTENPARRTDMLGDRDLRFQVGWVSPPTTSEQLETERTFGFVLDGEVRGVSVYDHEFVVLKKLHKKGKS